MLVGLERIPLPLVIVHCFPPFDEPAPLTDTVSSTQIVWLAPVLAVGARLTVIVAVPL